MQLSHDKCNKNGACLEWGICCHYNDVIMSMMASQITSVSIVYSTVFSGPGQRKHQSSASLAFVRGIHRSPVNSPHKGPVTRKCFHLMTSSYARCADDLFVKADNPYDTRDKYKLIQPLKRTTTYGLRSFQYFGAHVWNMLSINIKAAHSLHEFKSLIRSWPGPKCSCHICIALLWLMSLLCIAHCGGGLSVWRLCGRLWYRVAVTTTCGAVESS